MYYEIFYPSSTEDSTPKEYLPWIVAKDEPFAENELYEILLKYIDTIAGEWDPAGFCEYLEQEGYKIPYSRGRFIVLPSAKEIKSGLAG